jgi:hypothetical protein
MAECVIFLVLSSLRGDFKGCWAGRDLVALISFSRAAKCAAPNASQPESARKMSRVSRGVDILRHGIDITADMVRAKCFPEAALMLLL